VAWRYGGPHSPTPAANKTRRPERMVLRRNLLWLAPLPLLLTAFAGGALTVASDLVALGLLWGANWLLGEGLRAEAAYDERKVAKRPAIPRKLFASALTGIGVAMAAWVPDSGLVAPVIFGAVATGLHVLSFGPDPLRDKGGTDGLGDERVLRAVDEGEGLLSEMRTLIAESGDRELIARVERFRDTARALFREVEEDPRDLSGVRRYLSVYLMGARDATARFLDVWRKEHDAQARADYIALLDDLDQTFAARTRRLIEGARTDLDIEIGVLRDRLEREGVKTE
jgi:5-bromo-4-chloroindolyl phosphate hydrolysis protein